MSATSTSEKLLYLDTSLALEERVRDLVGRLTLEERVGLMNHPAHGIPYLNVPASTVVPLHHLIGFERLNLKAGESKTVNFIITPEMMSFYNDEGKLTLEPGQFRLEVGGCSPGQRGQALGAPKPVSAVFELI